MPRGDFEPSGKPRVRRNSTEPPKRQNGILAKRQRRLQARQTAWNRDLSKHNNGPRGPAYRCPGSMK